MRRDPFVLVEKATRRETEREKRGRLGDNFTFAKFVTEKDDLSLSRRRRRRKDLY